MKCQLKERNASTCESRVGSKECLKCSWYVTEQKIDELWNIQTRKELSNGY
jgi:hypothetical protein